MASSISCCQQCQLILVVSVAVSSASCCKQYQLLLIASVAASSASFYQQYKLLLIVSVVTSSISCLLAVPDVTGISGISGLFMLIRIFYFNNFSCKMSEQCLLSHWHVISLTDSCHMISDSTPSCMTCVLDTCHSLPMQSNTYSCLHILNVYKQQSCLFISLSKKC